MLLACACLRLAQRGRDSSHAVVVVGRVVRAVAVNVCMDAILGTKEGLAGLLGFFFVVQAVVGEANGTVQYIFADRVARAVADPDVGMGVGVVVQAAVRGLEGAPNAQALAQMVVIQLAGRWVASKAPIGLGAVTGLLLAYFASPLLADTGVGRELFGFVAYRAAGALEVGGVDRWVQAVMAATLWLLGKDTVTKQLAQTAGAHSAVGVILDGVGPLLRTDPVLAVLAVASALGTLLAIFR